MGKTLGTGLFALAAVALVGGLTMAGDTKLKVGDKVTKLVGTDEAGKEFDAKGLLGKKVIVLYFYPADFTGGCTAQACAFRDDIEKLGSKDVVVIGVSGDSPETHAAFKKHHKLPFTLLADEKGALAKQFGVPVSAGGTAKVKVDGKAAEFTRGVTTARYTVVIGKDQMVKAVDKVGNAKADSERVLNLVKSLEK